MPSTKTGYEKCGLVHMGKGTSFCALIWLTSERNTGADTSIQRRGSEGSRRQVNFEHVVETEDSAASRNRIVLNWIEELTERVPVP